MPRIITVDPTGSVGRIVRSAMDLLDLSVTQVDAPTAKEGLEELNRPANLVVSAFELDDMKGFEYALRVRRESQETSILILGDVDDPKDLDEETTLNSPFVYMSRPVDIQKFLRVLIAGLESHEAMIAALASPSSTTTTTIVVDDMGPVPAFSDLGTATTIVDTLLQDLGAMAIILASRAGETLLERGAVGYIDRDALAGAMVPVMRSNVTVKDLVGGQLSTVQFYDGDNYDIFVLSVGLHHCVFVLFDGQMGARQFGLVNRFGRRSVEDLIALLGANAFFIQPPIVEKKEETVQKRSQAMSKKPKAVEEEPIELARAEINDATQEEPESAMPQLEPIKDLDLDALFGDSLSGGDDLFDMDKIEEIAKASQTEGSKSALDWEQAQQLGILKG